VLEAFVSVRLQKFSISQIEELVKRKVPEGVCPKAREMGTERYRKPRKRSPRGREYATRLDFLEIGKSATGTNRCGLFRAEFLGLSGSCNGKKSTADRHRRGPSRDPVQEPLEAWGSQLPRVRTHPCGSIPNSSRFAKASAWGKLHIGQTPLRQTQEKTQRPSP